MWIRILEGENSSKIVFKEVKIEFINRIRKLLVTKIPTYAIENVTFTKNQSYFFDEIVAHRIALIPIIAENAGCIEFYGKATQNVLTIRQLWPKESSVSINLPKGADIVIAPMPENGEIAGTAEITKGTMDQHAKWASCWAYVTHEDYFATFDEYKVDDTLSSWFHQAYDAYEKDILTMESEHEKNKFIQSKVYPYTILTIESNNRNVKTLIKEACQLILHY